MWNYQTVTVDTAEYEYEYEYESGNGQGLLQFSTSTAAPGDACRLWLVRVVLFAADHDDLA